MRLRERTYEKAARESKDFQVINLRGNRPQNLHGTESATAGAAAVTAHLAVNILKGERRIPQKSVFSEFNYRETLEWSRKGRFFAVGTCARVWFPDVWLVSLSRSHPRVSEC